LGGKVSEVTSFPDAASVLASAAGILVEQGQIFHAAVRRRSSLESDVALFVRRVEIPVIGGDGEISGVFCRDLRLTSTSRSTPPAPRSISLRQRRRTTRQIFEGEAGQDARKNMAAPFILLLQDGTIGGYYTVSSTAVKLAQLPEQVIKKLPRYPLVPATLLGRLAIDRSHQGKGYGRFLLADALHRAVRSEIASFAVIVDAKDDNARRFYERESFLPFFPINQ
jgi:GNAT superfamily N-acetyltransferase